MDGSHSLLFRSDSSLALRCRKGAIHPSFNHLVGGRKQRRWNGETKRSGSRNVDDEIELGRLHHWKVGWFGALENAGGIEPRHPKRLRQAGAVAHQASSLGGLTRREDGRETVASRQRGELYSSAKEIPIGADNESIRSLPRQRRESVFDCASVARPEDNDFGPGGRCRRSRVLGQGVGIRILRIYQQTDPYGSRQQFTQ